MLIKLKPTHFSGEFCPSCVSDDRRKRQFYGKLVVRNGKFGEFLGCSRYPDCKYSCERFYAGSKRTRKIRIETCNTF